MFFWTKAKGYAKRKLLESKAVIGMVGQLVENVVCTILETIVIGSTSYVIKEFVSPWTWTDVLFVDIGVNVAYILFLMPLVRLHFHKLFKKPCQKIGRKILGLDIRDPWAFLKLKYSIMTTIMTVLLIVFHSIQDVASFARLLCFETMIIQMSVDVWNFHGEEIQEYVATNLEPKPQVHIFREKEESKLPTTPTPPASPTPQTPRLLNATVFEEYCKVK